MVEMTCLELPSKEYKSLLVCGPRFILSPAPPPSKKKRAGKPVDETSTYKLLIVETVWWMDAWRFIVLCLLLLCMFGISIITIFKIKHKNITELCRSGLNWGSFTGRNATISGRQWSFDLFGYTSDTLYTGLRKIKYRQPLNNMGGRGANEVEIGT